jgi:hypothetical protein
MHTHYWCALDNRLPGSITHRQVQHQECAAEKLIISDQKQQRLEAAHMNVSASQFARPVTPVVLAAICDQDLLLLLLHLLSPAV